MTIRGLFREFAIAKERRDESWNVALSAAWHTAALQRVDKLPPLKSLLKKPESNRPQSVDQQRGLMNLLSQHLGIPMRKTRLKKAASKHGG